MIRFLCITLGLLVTLASATAQTIEIVPEKKVDPPKAKPADKKDKDDEALYSGRTLKAWIEDLKGTDVLIREEAIEVLAQIGTAAKGATVELKKLLKADDRNLRIRAALALWKIGGESTGIPAILAEALKTASLATRHEALVALAALGPTAAATTNVVVEALDDPDPTIRVEAGKTLTLFGKAAMPILIESLKSKSPTVRQNVLVHLGIYMATHLNKSHVPALTARLQDDTLRCRVEAARLLWSFGQHGDPVVAALLEGAKVPGDTLQGSILSTLYSSSDKPRTILPILEVCLKGANVPTRVDAARILFSMEKKTDRVLPIYMDILGDDSPQGRSNIGYAISGLVDLKADARPALPRLVQLLKLRDFYAPYEMRTVLKNIGTPAVNPLVGILEDTTFQQYSSSHETAITALGGLGQPAAKTVMPLLSAKDVNTRIRAIRVFSALGIDGKDAVPKLVEAIKDPTNTVRDAALQALGNMGDVAKGAVPQLVELAKGTDLELRLVCLRTLASIGPDAKDIVPLCLSLLKDPNASLQQASLNLLVAVAPNHKAILPTSLKLLDNSTTRIAGLQLIGTIGPAGVKAVPRVLKLLDDPDLNIKRTAIYTLGQIGPAAKPAVPSLLELLDSPNADIRTAAAQTLHNLEPDVRVTLPKMIAFLEKHTDASTVPILELLGENGKLAEKAFPAILAALDDTRRPPLVRANAALALALIDPARAKKDVLPGMRKLLTFPDQKLFVARAIFTADNDDKEAIGLFESQLGNASSTTRSIACSTLALIGPPAKRFLPKIREQFEDKEYYLRSSAANAIYHITKDAKEALPTLEAILGDTTQPYSKGYAAYYLGEMGLAAKSCLPKLEALRTNSDSYTRTQAITAVKKIEKAIDAASPPKAHEPDENP